MSRPTHIKSVKKRRKRREKIKKLREKYLKATSQKEKEEIIEKALRVNPYLSREEFLLPIKKSSSIKKSS